MNIVNLNGRIMGIYNGKNIGVVTLKVIDGNWKDGKIYKNFPRVEFKKYDKSVLYGFNKGDEVRIEGTVKVRNETRDDGKIEFSQFIRGSKIFKNFKDSKNNSIKSLKRPKSLYKNEVIITGVITGLIKVNNNASVLICPDEQKFNTRLLKFNAENFLNKYKQGDRITVRCRVQTEKKENKYIENLVILNAEESES